MTARGTAPGRKWDEESFFAEIEARYSAGETEFVRRFYEWNRAKGYRIAWGTGKTVGSFGARVPAGSLEYVPAVCYTNSGVELQLYWMRTWPPFDQLETRRQFVRLINEIPGASVPEDDYTLENRRPAIPFSVFTTEEAFSLLTDAIDWFATEAQRIVGA